MILIHERVEELAKQADEYLLEKVQEENRSSWAQVFAELIVEKCAGIIESQDVDPAFKLRMSWAVKKHFGVDLK